ncbi:MAG: four helix bundle protein [Candidatus Paceibacteria bacterium]
MNQESREEYIRIKNFTDLKAWREGHDLVLRIYAVTEDFPKKETFGLVSQMRRAALSITSNIAEGFSRQTKKEKQQSFHVSLGSTSELQSQLFVTRDTYLIDKECFNELYLQTVKVHKLTNGLMKGAQKRSLSGLT